MRAILLQWGHRSSLEGVSISALARSGEKAAGVTFPFLNEASRRAPPGELTQFTNLLVANQYRVPYGLSMKFLRTPSTVLDWGCGDGHFSYFLLEQGHAVTSYSLQHEPFVLRTLPSHLSTKSRYVQGEPAEPTRLPFPDSSFDAVFSVGVLEHVRETGGTEVGSLLEIRRVLRPGGYFLCFHLPNSYSYIEALARLLRRRTATASEDGYHSFRFSAGDVRSLCRQAELIPVARGRYAFLPRNGLSRLPESLGGSEWFARLVNMADNSLAWAFGAICQNHFLVARSA